MNWKRIDIDGPPRKNRRVICQMRYLYKGKPHGKEQIIQGGRYIGHCLWNMDLRHTYDVGPHWQVWAWSPIPKYKGAKK